MKPDEIAAADRLEKDQYPSGVQSLVGINPKKLGDYQAVAAAYLAQAQRQRQAVTVEGLRAAGFTEGRTTHLCERVRRTFGERQIIVEFWGDGSINWVVNNIHLGEVFFPQNMWEADRLIERLEWGA